MYWRWEWDNCLHGLITNVQDEREPNTSTIEQGDSIIRAYWGRLPAPLKTPLVWLDSPSMPVEQVNTGIQLQQIRIALHFSTGLLQCHRASFHRALTGPSAEPLDLPFQESVRVLINEACPTIIKLVEQLYALGLGYTRHIVS